MRRVFRAFIEFGVLCWVAYVDIWCFSAMTEMVIVNKVLKAYSIFIALLIFTWTMILKLSQHKEAAL
jgi:hypothetical protein